MTTLTDALAALAAMDAAEEESSRIFRESREGRALKVHAMQAANNAGRVKADAADACIAYVRTLASAAKPVEGESERSNASIGELHDATLTPTGYGVPEGICPTCQGLGTANPTPAAVQEDDAIAGLPALWRRQEDNGEARTDFDAGYEQASNECATDLEAALAHKPVQVDDAKDAARYRWLCKEANRDFIEISSDIAPIPFESSGDLDAFIDAALAHKPTVQAAQCPDCGCKLTKHFGGLVEHKSDCPRFPL